MNIKKISPIKGYNFNTNYTRKNISEGQTELISQKNHFSMEALSFLGQTTVKENAFSKKYREMQEDFANFKLSSELRKITPQQQLSVRKLDPEIIEKLDTFSFYRIHQLQRFQEGEKFIRTLNGLTPESKEFLFSEKNVKHFPALVYNENDLHNSIKNIKLFDRLFDARKFGNIPPITYDVKLILFLSGQEEDNSDTNNKTRIQQLMTEIPYALRNIG